MRALVWGLVAGSALIFGALAGYTTQLSQRLIDFAIHDAC